MGRCQASQLSPGPQRRDLLRKSHQFRCPCTHRTHVEVGGTHMCVCCTSQSTFGVPPKVASLAHLPPLGTWYSSLPDLEVDTATSPGSHGPVECAHIWLVCPGMGGGVLYAQEKLWPMIAPEQSFHGMHRLSTKSESSWKGGTFF